MIKKSFFLLTVFLLSLNTEAQNALNSEAFDIAQRFMAKKGITLVNDDKAATRGNAEPYSIFNGEKGKGFAIVVNGNIVGYSTENTADVDNMPPALESMLDFYAKIPRKGSTRGDDNDYPPEFVPLNAKPIPYMIKTQWGQDYPYNLMTPTINGEHCPAGCSAVALAQLLNYFRHPYVPKVVNTQPSLDKGYGITFEELPPYQFQWDKVLDKYSLVKGVDSEESVKEIATIMKYCGYMLQANYTPNVTTAGIAYKAPNNPCLKYFDFYDAYGAFDNEIEGQLAKHIEMGIPVFCGTCGHNFLIDGRDADGLYHFNLGWNGSMDGYYIVSKELYEKYGENHGLTRYSNLLYIVLHIPTKDWTTSINKVDYKPNVNESVYNLNGQYVGNSLEGLPKGIYIKDGKKVIIK